MTTNKRFLDSGHLPTLIGALLYFDVSFMVWVLLGPLTPFLRDEFHLTATQQGLLVAVPLGNGAVFQLVPQRFADRMGLVTGIVGAAGGLGGFFLPSMLGAVRDAAGTYAPGLLLLAFAFFAGAIGLLLLGSVWATRWQTDAVKQSGIFCYRDVVRGWRGQQVA
jgi:MFS transporter, NNP family, nitrate/nitrite transporter